jgi:hypothetical protein
VLEVCAPNAREVTEIVIDAAFFSMQITHLDYTIKKPIADLDNCKEECLFWSAKPGVRSPTVEFWLGRSAFSGDTIDCVPGGNLSG